MTDFEYRNAADDLLESNLGAGRGDRIAVIDGAGEHSYAELAERVDRFAGVLRDSGIGMEQRVMLCLQDTVDFPTCFLGAIKAGAVAVPVSTLLAGQDYEYMLHDSRARALVVSEALLPKFEALSTGSPFLQEVWVAGADAHGFTRLEAALAGASPAVATAPTRRDDTALWLYTSGTTGRPKAAIHAQTALLDTARLYAEPILGISAEDRVFSAAKLFFAYGLGNALTFPFAVGATAILLADRPTPQAVVATLDSHRPTLFFGVPTLYAMMLNTGVLPDRAKQRLRLCVSAGEALPENVLERWQAEVGVDILDGIGSTEMLHIYMSNRAGAVAPGTSGRPVEGYEVKIVNEQGAAAADGEIGDLYVKGPTRAAGYWNRRAKSEAAFVGPWMLTGDKYYCDPTGNYVYAGRSDDLLKVGGLYVSPMEVENALMSHPAVAEAAVVGAEDRDRLIKPKAFVTLGEGHAESQELADELIGHVRQRLAEYKRPRWVEFIDELPKTATGKIQRFKLRAKN